MTVVAPPKLGSVSPDLSFRVGGGRFVGSFLFLFLCWVMVFQAVVVAAMVMVVLGCSLWRV
jgi:hypothetical protein